MSSSSVIQIDASLVSYCRRTRNLTLRFPQVRSPQVNIRLTTSSPQVLQHQLWKESRLPVGTGGHQCFHFERYCIAITSNQFGSNSVPPIPLQILEGTLQKKSSKEIVKRNRQKSSKEVLYSSKRTVRSGHKYQKRSSVFFVS